MQITFNKHSVMLGAACLIIGVIIGSVIGMMAGHEMSDERGMHHGGDRYMGHQMMGNDNDEAKGYMDNSRGLHYSDGGNLDQDNNDTDATNTLSTIKSEVKSFFK